MITIISGNATIYNVVRCWYSLALNEIRSFEIVTDGVDSIIRAELAVGNTVQIYRDGTLEFQGTIEEKEAFQGGGIIIRGLGQEVDFAEQKCPIDAGTHKKVYTSSNANTIFADIVGNVAGWSSDVVNSTATAISSFRTSDSQSAWNGIKDLLKLTKKDILVNDSTQKLYLYDELTNANVHVFNEGVNCGNVTHKTMKAKASKVVIYGKSDGENQIVGSAGSGTPIFEIVDRNIIQTSDANTRAATELARIVAAINVYNFNVYNSSLTFRIGDEVTINADSLGLDSVTVDIVRIKRGLNQGGDEYLDLEVTNPAYRIASKNNAWVIAQLDEKSITSNSSMQGSGNTLTFPRANNANNSVPLYINFNVPTEFITDEAGNIRINSMTLDYDVDKFKQEYGSPSFDGSDPQVQNSSASTAPDVANDSGNTAPGVSGSSGASWAGSVVGSDSGSGVSCPSGQWTTIASVNTANSGDSLYANFYVLGNSGGPEDILVKIENTGEVTGTDSRFAVYQDGFRDDAFARADGVFAGTDGNSDVVRLRVYPFTGAIVVNGFLSVYRADHTHSDGSYAAANHSHSDGTYAAANHPHADGTYDINAADIDNISIGDGVGEAGSENASEVDIHLDYWNGSSWVLDKHTIIGTGATLANDVDITNGGTYPDVAGLWRVRILTDSASADFVQGIVKIRHLLENT